MGMSPDEGVEPASRYEPAKVEEGIGRRWEESGASRADARSGRAVFTVAIPPPNVTGVLHMGHALNNTMQDIVVRFHRMLGEETLWLPGTDHAGIATQAVVEKKLFKENGLKREAMGREAFLKEVWAWKEVHGNRILEQLRRLGCSCDWSRTRFTMDPGMSRAVREAFVRLWEKNLIYRGARLVNWDCVLQTAVSDDEIDHVERKSHLWHIRYVLEDDPSRALVVATTRPETLLGDTAVAVHPEDSRHCDLIGRKVRLPLLDRRIPVIGDESVDPEFGTGAVKVTPGHDPSDYERGRRFQLALVNIFEPDGRLNENAGAYRGMKIEAARKKVVEDLEAQGLLEKVVEHVHSVAISDRSGSVIEPIVSEQWFVRMKELAQPAIEAVKTGALRFVPERWSRVYLDWLENVRDWCISRQLWWGHGIPVWYDADEVPVASRTDLKLGSPHPGTLKPLVRQDPDVLDTWASSWLWPFATLGWPERTEDLARFYPTQFLSTSREIIYLWVARMVMAGYEFLDHLPKEKRCPFATCYIHATVLDAQGRRMSKSLGNGIDPIDLINKYGADATRLSLALLTVEGQDIRFSEQRVEEARNFVNKLWNAARFVLSRIPDKPLRIDRIDARELEDRWILHRLRALVELTTDALQHCRFHDAAQALRRFVWNDFCDWYLEIAKVRFEEAAEAESRERARAVAVTILRHALRLLHPIVPFVTEAIAEKVHARAWAKEDSPALLMCSAWPAAGSCRADAPAEQEMSSLQALVVGLRNLRARNDVPDRAIVKAGVQLPSPLLCDSVQRSRAWLERLSRTELVTVATEVERPRHSDADVIALEPSGTAEIYVVLEGLVDFEARARDLEGKIEKLEQRLRAVEGKLATPGFVERAPAAVVAQERARLEALRAERQGLVLAFQRIQNER